MTVGTAIDMVEMLARGAGVTQKITPKLIREFIKLRYWEFIGKSQVDETYYTWTTDGSREIELPVSVTRVDMVLVDDEPADKVYDQEAERSYAANN